MANGLTFTIDGNTLALVFDQKLGRPIGTAFVFIKPNWAVTAKHVVIDKGIPRSDLFLHFVRGESNARFLYADKHLDLAVLEVAMSPCERPLFPAHTSLAGAGGLITAGYKPSKVGTDGSPSIEVNSVPVFTVDTRNGREGPEESIFFEASFSEGGHSGGPVFGAGGGVVGVVIEHFKNGGKLTARAISIAPLVAHLQFQI